MFAELATATWFGRLLKYDSSCQPECLQAQARHSRSLCKTMTTIYRDLHSMSVQNLFWGCAISFEIVWALQDCTSNFDTVLMQVLRPGWWEILFMVIKHMGGLRYASIHPTTHLPASVAVKLACTFTNRACCHATLGLWCKTHPMSKCWPGMLSLQELKLFSLADRDAH